MAAAFQNYSGGVLLADIVKRNNLSTYVSEAIKERSAFIRSGAVVRNALLNATEGGTRKSPIDNLNLARVFPGNQDGTITERIAHFISKQLIDKSSFLIDLHSSGTHISTPTLVGYDASEKGVNNGSKESAYLSELM